MEGEALGREEVSIIVPTFNRAHIVEECIDSIRSQIYPYWQLIVVDDGSTDSTEQVVRRYADADQRVHYLRQDNAGAGAARNRGAALASGSWITFLDSDDRALPNWLNTLMESATRQGAVIVSCGAYKLSKDKRTLMVPTPENDVTGGYTLHLLAGTFMLRKSLFDQVGGYDIATPSNQHTELGFRLFPVLKRDKLTVVAIEDPLVEIVVREGESIRKNDRAVYEGTVYLLRKHRALIETFNDDTLYSYLSVAGVLGCRIGDTKTGVSYLLQAIRVKPFNPKSIARLLYHPFRALTRG